MRNHLGSLSALLLLAPTAVGAQQNLFPQSSVLGGVEVRQYNFGSKFPADHIRQVALPFAVVLPIGPRFSLDIGSQYAITSVASAAGDSSFSHITDTQVRAAYVFGIDALVASVMFNLPTGAETTTLQKFGVTSAASSNFLLFPVNTYGSGFSVTPGIAGATAAGDWNLGLAASFRLSSKYHPFSDASSKNVDYKPGVETRIRAGADRLVGQSRLSLGVTFSTFGSDQLTGGSLTGGNGVYDPGNRFLVDASYLMPAGKGNVTLYAWNYFRSAGSAGSGSSSTSAANKENIFTGGVAAAFPIGTRATLEPLLETRLWGSNGDHAHLFGAGTGLRIQATPRIALVPSARADVGSITGISVFGWSVSALLSYGF